MDDFAWHQRASDSDSFTASLDWRGRITIPAQTRKRLFLKFKDTVFASVQKDAPSAYSESILDTIGNTPMVRVRNSKNVGIFAKLEKMNPGGSVKDRPAKYMIERAEKDGVLRKGMAILEATSGNTGIGLAMIAAAKGYKITLVMPESASEERKQMLRAFGAEITLTPKERGMAGAREKAKELAKTGNYFLTDQYSNKHNVLAHYETTGPEIWKQTDGKVTHFIAGMGTGGTLMGISKYLKEKNPKIRIIGVEPHAETPIPGLKNMETSRKTEIMDMDKVDERVVVRAEDAVTTAKMLAKEGLLVGLSSGAAMFVALKKAEKLDSGTIVVLFPDGGERYISTGVFN